jgi:hypothetical protein
MFAVDFLSLQQINHNAISCQALSLQLQLLGPRSASGAAPFSKLIDKLSVSFEIGICRF